MKYVIGEKKVQEIIKKYILKMYPFVSDVYYTESQIGLGSGPGIYGDEDVVTNINLNIVIDAINNELNSGKTDEYAKTIIRDINKIFKLNANLYGSKIEFRAFVDRRNRLF